MKDGDLHPLALLPREDLELVAQFVLVSGSLKELAAAYGVSYPTMRSRFDRLIDRLRDQIAGKPADPLSELLAGLVQRGEVSPATARAVRDVVRAEYAIKGDTRVD